MESMIHFLCPRSDEDDINRLYWHDISEASHQRIDADTEPLNFQNNALFWFPPGPEDEEDDKHYLPDDELLPPDNNSSDPTIPRHANDENHETEVVPPSLSDDTSIAVHTTTRCLWRGTTCYSHFIRIQFYGTLDVSLGQFLQGLFLQSNECHSCGFPSEAHSHCYTSHQGSLTVCVRRLPEFLLPGADKRKIWMWHRCLQCPFSDGFPPSAMRVVMSDAAQDLSFGKFLEQTFSNPADASLIANCGHSLHRDCVRFYGSGNSVACFQYAPISVYSVSLSLPMLDLKHISQADEDHSVANVIPVELTKDSHSLSSESSLPNEWDSSEADNSSSRGLAKQLDADARLLLSAGIKEKVVPVFDDEPTSIILYALASPDCYAQLSNGHERPKDGFKSSNSLPVSYSESLLPLATSDCQFTDYQVSVHAKVSLDVSSEEKEKYTVTCYYARQFEALRKMCFPSELKFLQSLNHCKQLGAQGGNNTGFLRKTLDERLVIKQVTKAELEGFIKFAPSYFKYLSESISTHAPTCLAKVLGIYQVPIKHGDGRKVKMLDVVVMENIFYRRSFTRLYNLNGCGTRFNQDSSGRNKVLLDGNLIEMKRSGSQIYVRNKKRRELERAVWNDTAFLSSNDVVGYSLLAGVDEENQELVVGIISYTWQYTWELQLKAFLGRILLLCEPKGASPAMVSPREYKKRFRKAMNDYFVGMPIVI